MTRPINPFRFKQFVVEHDRCAMKVGTDAVLLGSWANIYGAQTVLDIGSGSGVIALMIAQRTQPNVLIDAVENDADSFDQSVENVARTRWSDRIRIFSTAIQDFSPVSRYDLIVSNPPYFINSLLPPGTSRRDARHTSSLSHHDLLDSIKRLLKPEGKFCLTLPVTEGNAFHEEAALYGLHCWWRTAFYSRKSKPQERWLLELRPSPSNMVSDALELYDSGDQWTAEYKALTGDFYL